MKKLLAFLLLSTLSAAAQPVTTVRSLDNLLARTPIWNEVVIVQTGLGTNDWGGDREFKHDTTWAGGTNQGNAFAARNSGYWVAADRTAPQQDIRWFGAVGDGTTDDTAAIQAALDTGKSVLISGGSHKISSLTISSNNQEIVGINATLLLTLTNNSYAVTVAAGVTNLSMSGLRFDGGLVAPRGLLLRTNVQATLASMTFERFRENAATPLGVWPVAIRGNTDVTIRDSTFRDIRTAGGNGVIGDAIGVARAIYVDSESAQDLPPKRGLVDGCTFEDMQDTEDSDAVSVQTQGWGTLNCNWTVQNSRFIEIWKRAAKFSAGGCSFLNNYVYNTVASPDLGGVALSFYGINGKAEGNRLELGYYYSWLDLGAGTNYPATGARISQNVVVPSDAANYYPNSVGILVDGRGSSNILIQGNSLGIGDFRGIGLTRGGTGIKILDNVLIGMRSTNYGSGVYIGTVDALTTPFAQAENIDVIGNTFRGWTRGASVYGASNVVWRLNDVPVGTTDLDIYPWEDPGQTNAASNYVKADRYNSFDKRWETYNNSAWTFAPSSTEATTSGGVTAGSWYRVASADTVAASSTLRNSAIISVGTGGGSAEPTVTRFAVDVGFSQRSSIHLLNSTPSSSALIKAIRLTSNTNGVLAVDIQPKVSTTARVTVHVETVPVVTLYDPVSQWYATAITNVASLEASETVRTIMERVDRASSAYEQDSSGYSWMLGQWFQAPTISTANRDALIAVTNLVSGGMIWNTTTQKHEFYEGDGWQQLSTRQELPWVDVRWFGAVGDGVTDDTAAIQAAADFCVATTNTLLFPPSGDGWRVTSTLWLTNINIKADPSSLILTTNNSVAGVVVGGFDTDQIRPHRVEVPLVKLDLAYEDHTATNGIGVLILSARHNEFHIYGTERQHTGVKMDPVAPKYASNNRIFLGSHFRHKIGIDITYTGYPSFNNDNTFYAGYALTRYTTFGTRTSGYKAIWVHPDIRGGTNAWTDMNNNRFLGTVVEGGAWEYDLWVEGRNNLFDWCRFETGTTNVPIFVFYSDTNSPATTWHNRIRGGGFMSPHGVPRVIQAGTAVGNSVDSESTVSFITTTETLGESSIKTQNTQTNGFTFQSFPSDTDAYSLTNWNFSFADQYFRAKLRDDPNSRYYVQETGRQGWGDGQTNYLTATVTGPNMKFLASTHALSQGTATLAYDNPNNGASSVGGFLALAAGNGGGLVTYAPAHSQTNLAKALVLRPYDSSSPGIRLMTPYAGQSIEFIVSSPEDYNTAGGFWPETTTNITRMHLWDNRLGGRRKVGYAAMNGVDMLYLLPSSGLPVVPTPGNGLTNSGGLLHTALDAGANVTLTTNAQGRITIAAASGGGGATNGTAVYVEGSFADDLNIIAGADIYPDLSSTNLTLILINTTVAAGSYTSANITVDSKGRITAAANGTGGSGITSIEVNGTAGVTNLVNSPYTTWTKTNGTAAVNITGFEVENSNKYQSTNTVLTRIGGLGAGVSGDIIYRDVNGWTNLAKGTDGQVLTLASGFPAWDDPTSGSSSGFGNVVFSVTNDVTVLQANTTETTILGNVKNGQSKTIPAGSITAGTIYKLDFAGKWSSSADYSGNVMRAYFGGLTITFESTVEPYGTTHTDSPFSGVLWITFKTVGETVAPLVSGNVMFQYDPGNAGDKGAMILGVSQSGAVDTTGDNLFDLTWDNGAQPMDVTLTHAILSVPDLASLGSGNSGVLVNSSGTATNLVDSPSGSWARTNGTVAFTVNNWTRTIERFTAAQMQPPAANNARFLTRNSIGILRFDPTTQQSANFVFSVPDSYAGSTVTIILHSASSATSGNYRFGAQIARLTGVDIDSDTYATAVEATTATSGTAGLVTTLTLSAVGLDSAVAGDFVQLNVYRDTGDAADTVNSNDMELIGVEVRAE